MKNRIIVILGVIVIYLLCFFVVENNYSNAQEINTTIRPIPYFVDKNINKYTIEELEARIAEQLDIQKKSHDLAVAARELGWPESCDAIQSAKIEWQNAQLAIDKYSAVLAKEIEKQEQERWRAKTAEYPAATKIWLYMKDLGWNDYICAGIMGNLMTEVGGQTLNIKYWSNNEYYYGMCQWNHAYKRDVWGADLKRQLVFLEESIQYEFDTFGYMYENNFDFNSFLELNDEQKAALAFAKCYERCGSGTYSIRQKNATNAYNYFVN